MTHCNNPSISFSSFDGRKVLAKFDGGTITSDAGALLLRQADQQIQLIEQLDQCIPDPRNQQHTIHSQRSMLAQRIFGIALAYEDLNDHQTLRNDLLWQTLCERANRNKTPMASAPTLCRLENRNTLTREVLVDMSTVFVETFIKSHDAPPKELVLDFDATDDLIHGHQEKRFFHGYYRNNCYLPLYVFCGNKLLVAYLRPSNIDAAKHSWAILALLVKRFRQAWPGVKIVFRGDSGFCRWKMLRWCDKHDVGYLVGIAKNPVLMREADKWVQHAKQQFQASKQKQRIFGEFTYKAKSWDCPRKIVVKAEHLEKGPNTRFILTNLSDATQLLYDEQYCARGEMENRIKEQQLYLFADRTSCSAFLANQFRLLLSSAAYVLVEHIRQVGLMETELANATVETIRLKLFKIGAQICQSVRRIVLHFSSSYPYQKLFGCVLERLGPVRFGWPCFQ